MNLVLIALIAVFFVLWLESFVSRINLRVRLKSKGEFLDEEINKLTYDNKNLISRIKWLNLTYSQVLSSVIHLSSMLSLDEIKEAVVRMVGNSIDADKVVLFLADENEEYLRPIAYRGISKELFGKLSYRFGEGRIVLVAKRRLALTDKEFGFYFSGDVGPDLFKPQICSPIIFQTRLLGVIGVSGLGKITDDHKQIINFISSATGMALNNAMSFKRLQYSASIDKLTGLYNMQFFREKLHEAVKGAKANGNPVSVCLTDLDKFKNFNDTFGHPMGDRLLYRITKLYVECFPEMIVARYGGDEFIVLGEGKNRRQMYEIADKLRQRIEKENFSAGKGERITVSGGIASYPDDATSGEQLVRMADQALYLAKQGGRNRVVFYSPTM